MSGKNREHIGFPHTQEYKKRMSEYWRNNPKTNENIKHLTKINSIPVLQIDKKTNKVIKKWDSAADATRALGLGSGTIGKIAKKNIRNPRTPFRWEFCKEGVI